MVLVTEKLVKDLIYEGEERKQSWRSVRTQAQVKGAGKAVKPHLKEGWKEKRELVSFWSLYFHIYTKSSVLLEVNWKLLKFESANDMENPSRIRFSLEDCDNIRPVFRY